MDKLLETIRGIVGSSGVLTGADVSARPDSWPPIGNCQARAIVRPSSTKEVAQILKLCNAIGQPIVAHGGLTGLVGGARAAPDDIVLSLERMRGMQPVDTANRTVVVEAGVPLQQVQEAAEAANLLFPLDLGARGSATIGGTIATNAGGNSVIRYGMAREQVLGIEAVLADGTVISSLKDVIKNNTGYDLKQLFIGSEGTLGVVTRAVLRLRPKPRSCSTALIASDSFDKVAELLRAMDTALGGTLSAFEVMWNDFYHVVVGDGQRHEPPLDGEHAFYVLLESTGGSETEDPERFESALQEAFQAGLLEDAVIAQNQKQAAELWAIRDDVEALVARLHPPLAFDISLGVPQLDGYVKEVRSALTALWPAARMVTFGHLGDGNIHLVISIGSMERAQVQQVEKLVYEALGRRGGVISAEHGIGLDKRAYLGHSRSPEEIALMRTLKKALDPNNILNPGKII